MIWGSVERRSLPRYSLRFTGIWVSSASAVLLRAPGFIHLLQLYISQFTHRASRGLKMKGWMGSSKCPRYRASECAFKRDIFPFGWKMWHTFHSCHQTAARRGEGFRWWLLVDFRGELTKCWNLVLEKKQKSVWICCRMTPQIHFS